MATDITVTINPPSQIPVTIGGGIPAHAPTHAPGASDTLDAYYLPRSETGQFLTSGNVVQQSQTGAFLDTGSTQTINSLKSFLVRPTVGGTGVLLIGEDAVGNTGSLTGVFYPLHANPSGYITGVDLSNYVVKSSTGDFVTSGQTGNFITASQTGQFVSTGATGTFVTGSVVRPSDTGAFYPVSNPSGFITGVDLTNYVTKSSTGSFVTTGQTGSFVTISQTGTFASSSQVVLLTGNQTVSGTKDFASRPTVSGTPILLSGEGGGTVNTGALTGAFYPLNSNPSGYITGVDLSSYATTAYVTGVSGSLQNQISFTRTGGASDYYMTLTGAQQASGVKTFHNNAVFESGINSSGKFVFNTGFFPTVGAGEMSWNSDYDTVQLGVGGGNVVHTVGFKSFYRVKANAAISKGKVVMALDTVGNSEFILAQEAANIGLSGELIMGVSAADISAGAFGDVVAFGAVKGVDTSAFVSGAILYFDPLSTGGLTETVPSPPNAKVIVAMNLNPSSNGTVFVRVSAGSALGVTDSNVKFSSLSNNDFITYSSSSGFWYNKALTTGDVSGISAYALAANTGSFITSSQTGQFVSTGATGSFVVSSATGAFLTTGAADNRYALQSATGSFVTTGQTGAFVAASQTGAFLTTGAADARYALQSATGTFITSGQTGIFLTTGIADSRYTAFVHTGEIYIDAGAMLTGNASGAASTGVSFPNSGLTSDAYNFDSASNQYALFKFAFPDNWNKGTINSKFYWTASGSSGNVVWGMQAAAFGNSGVIDGSWGAAQEVTDTYITGNALHVSPATAAITVANSPSANNLIMFRTYRNAAATGDSYSLGANLLGVKIQYIASGNISSW